jgi:hypothetical protein
VETERGDTDQDGMVGDGDGTASAVRNNDDDDHVRKEDVIIAVM